MYRVCPIWTPRLHMPGTEEMPKPVKVLALVQHKALKSQWISCPILFCGLVSLGSYARMVSEGDTYHPVCIWLASRMWIHRTLRVGKVGI